MSTVKKNNLISILMVTIAACTLYCRIEGGRVKLSGKAALYSIAELYIGGIDG